MPISTRFLCLLSTFALSAASSSAQTTGELAVEPGDILLIGEAETSEATEFLADLEGEAYEIVYEDVLFEAGDEGVRPVDDTNAELDPLIYASGAPLENGRDLSIQEGLFDLLSSGLPLALAQRDMMRSLSGVASQDVNSRLLRARTRALAGPTAQGDKQAAPQALGKNPGKEPIPFNFQPTDEKTWEVFASANYQDSDFDERPLTPAFDSQTYAGTLGVEWRQSKTRRFGLAGAYVRSDADFHGLGDVETEGFVVMPYLSYTRGALYGDLLYGYSQYENQVRRRSLGSTARGDQDAREHEIQYNTGYKFQSGRLLHGPTLGLRYVNGKLDEYTQSGGPAPDLKVEEQDYNSLVSRLGWQFSLPMETGAGRITPHLRAAWAHDFLDSEHDVTVDNGIRVSLENTDELQEDSLVVGAGVLWDISGAAHVAVDYEAEVLRSDFNSHWVSVRFGLKF